MRTICRFAVLLAVVGSSTRVGGDEFPTPITRPTISSQFPTEVVDGDDKPLAPDAVLMDPFMFFDDFSWRSFVALMWPAKPGVRGEADTDRKITDKDQSGPRVWETWKSAYEAIPLKDEIPTEWKSFDARTPCTGIPAKDSGKRRIIASFTKFGDVSQALFGDLAGPLVCQNDTYAHYEIKVNQKEFEFILTNKLYDRTVIDALMEPKSFTKGSAEVKAAWREFRDEPESTRARYYRTRAMVENYKSGKCEEKELGLIGFHIVQKTPLRPQWVWSSFEHIDNVPSFGQPPTAGATFTLNDPTKPQKLDPDNDHAPAAVTDATYLKPDGAPFIGPMQVVRERPIEGKTAVTNTRYQNALRDTVFSKYLLVVTQWPKTPSQPSGNPFPGRDHGTVIANTTMETYFQNDISCMACHNSARTQNLDFVFFPIVHAFRHDPGPAGSPSRVFVEQLSISFQDARIRSGIVSRERLGIE